MREPSCFYHHIRCSMIQLFYADFQWKMMNYYILTIVSKLHLVPRLSLASLPLSPPNSGKYWNLWTGNWCGNENKLPQINICLFTSITIKKKNSIEKCILCILFSENFNILYLLPCRKDVEKFNCILWNRRKSSQLPMQNRIKNGKPKCIIIS